jgi:enamine deaminase RidA (YjgF/YER057c/UK114 family)
LFFNCRPPSEVADAAQQAEAAYRGILDVLDAEGGSYGSVVSETLFLRNARGDLESVRRGRNRALKTCETPSHRPARTEVQQPPLYEGNCLEISIQAVLPKHPLRAEVIETKPTCDCADCNCPYGLRIRVGDEVRFYASGLYGGGEGAYEQTHAMLGLAESLLQDAEMAFSDVMRTWIYLPEMERDYADLNRARREFFNARGIDPIPASTGIGAGLVPAVHDIGLGFYAIKSDPQPARTVMTTPTLNEAPEYGSDFCRGMRVAETNKVALLVSGTASIDETGRTVHLDDLEAQADRMLVNVAQLLQRQGASFDDVVSAITYVKHSADAQRLRDKFHEAGFEGFPNVLVEAPVCRPELLCETEVLATLPATAR